MKKHLTQLILLFLFRHYYPTSHKINHRSLYRRPKYNIKFFPVISIVSHPVPLWERVCCLRAHDLKCLHVNFALILANGLWMPVEFCLWSDRQFSAQKFWQQCPQETIKIKKTKGDIDLNLLIEDLTKGMRGKDLDQTTEVIASEVIGVDLDRETEDWRREVIDR